LKTPVFVHYGTEDPFLSWNIAESYYKKFKDGEREFTMHLEPGLVHAIGRKGRELLKKYFYKFVGK